MGRFARWNETIGEIHKTLEQRSGDELWEVFDALTPHVVGDVGVEGVQELATRYGGYVATGLLFGLLGQPQVFSDEKLREIALSVPEDLYMRCRSLIRVYGWTRRQDDFRVCRSAIEDLGDPEAEDLFQELEEVSRAPKDAMRVQAERGLEGATLREGAL